MTDPELIHERYGRDVELVIDGGAGDVVPTTVVDLTGGEPEICGKVKVYCGNKHMLKIEEE